MGTDFVVLILIGDPFSGANTNTLRTGTPEQAGAKRVLAKRGKAGARQILIDTEKSGNVRLGGDVVQNELKIRKFRRESRIWSWHRNFGGHIQGK